MSKKSRSKLEVARATPSLAATALMGLKGNIFSILSVVFGVSALTMILASTFAPSMQVSGSNLVLIEVQVLPGFYMKPITFFQYCMFLSFAFGLNSPITRQRFLVVRSSILRTFYIGAWLVAMGSAFEILYQVVIWSASLAVQGLSNPDIVVNIFPISVNPSPINVVFASKIIVAIFFMSLFLIDYLHRIDRTRQEKQFAERLSGARR
jgi:hypothetical protein